jgi:lipopolysaccharide export system permease protein
VFSIGNFTRHSEITAAKASGISFYRLAAPIILGALLATGLDLAIAELVPITDARRNELIGDTKSQSGTQRYNFAYAAEFGRVYKAQSLDVPAGRLEQLQIERKGNGRDYPTVLIAAAGAQYTPGRGWIIQNGVMHVISDSQPPFAMKFATMKDSLMTERPVDMMAKPRDPQEMRFAELSRFIRSLERSGGDASVLRVERALKIAIPVTCLVIALFGAPLATSTQRGGTAYGIGLSLAITVTFLMLIQLTKAVGGKGIIAPDVAAWLPNALFALMGFILLARVRT